MENSDRAVDDPWPVLVGVAGKETQIESLEEVVTAVLRQEGGRQYFSDILVSADAETALRLLSTFSDEVDECRFSF